MFPKQLFHNAENSMTGEIHVWPLNFGTANCPSPSTQSTVCRETSGNRSLPTDPGKTSPDRKAMGISYPGVVGAAGYIYYVEEFY